MFKLIILFILVAVFSIFALNDFLGLWAYVREGLEYFFNFVENSWWGKKPLLNIGICKNTILLKT